MNKLIRHTQIAEKIILIDGISGSGKSVLLPVLSSFRNTEKGRMEHIYEYLSILHSLKKIDTDAAIYMMRIYADLAIYNQMISREVNLRIHDDSGLLNNPKPLEYIARLFYKDGETVLKRIKKYSPILNIMTHQILPNIDLAFQSFGQRLKVVVMVRHPLYMIDHWINYIERYGTDPREFSIWLDCDGKKIPWFAYGWEEKYLASNSTDKSIMSIAWLIRKSYEAYDKLSSNQKDQVIIIPFERFVIEPGPYINALEHLLDTKITSKTMKVLKRQRCPRATLSAGRGHKNYGWKKAKQNNDDLSDFNQRKSSINIKANMESINILTALSREYEEKYQLKSQSPWCFFT
jgi:hypothetical protein